jgi:tetratricopeptide (TPR) repeat protein
MHKVRAAIISFCLLLLCSPAFADSDSNQNRQFLPFIEKNYRLALSRYKSAPENVDTAIQFARVSFDRAEFANDSDERENLAEPAIQACERALSKNETNAALHYYLGMNLGQLARTKGIGALKLVRQMEKEFLRARDLNSELDYAGPDRNLGLLYLNAPGWPTSIGNNTKARQHLMRAVQIAPNYPENHLNLLEAFIKFNDEEGAQREAQTIFAMLPKAHETFTGEEWASSWADWESRWHKFEGKLAQKPHTQSPRSRK